MQYLTLPHAVENELKDLTEALRIQTRIIGALILREIRTRFHNNPIGYFWAVLDPCFHMAVWFFMLMYLRGGDNIVPVHGVGPILFLASGILPYQLFVLVGTYVSQTVNESMSYVDYPVVKYIDVVFSRFIVESCTHLTVMIFIFSSLHLMGLAPLPDNYLGLFLPCGLLMLLGLGYGSALSCYVYLSPIIRDLKAVAQRFLYFSSGIYFLGDGLPSNILYWLSWNPVFNGVDLFRSAYFANYKSSWASPSYIFFWAVALFLFGLCSERVLRGKLNET